MMIISLALLFYCSCVVIIPGTAGLGTECQHEGKVEIDPDNDPIVRICTGGQWGYICGHDNKLQQVNVVCQELGLGYKDDKEDKYIETNITLTPVRYNGFTCRGFETQLKYCSSTGIFADSEESCRVKNSNNYRYLAALCKEPPPLELCKNGELKINKTSKFLMVCAFGKFHVICGDSYSWAEAQAEVACRQLGMNPKNASVKTVSPSASTNYFDLLNYRFHCIGNETSLFECGYSELDSGCNKHHSSVVGLQCKKSPLGPYDLILQHDGPILTIKWNYYPIYNYYFMRMISFTVQCQSTDNSSFIEVHVGNATQINMSSGLMINNALYYNCCVLASVYKGEVVSDRICKTVNMTTTVESLNTGDDNTHNANIKWGSIGSSIGLLVGALLMIAIVPLVMTFWRKKRKPRQHTHGPIYDTPPYGNNPNYMSGLYPYPGDTKPVVYDTVVPPAPCIHNTAASQYL